MLRLLALLGGVALFFYMLLRLGPGEILEMLLRLGWRFAGVVALYALYQLVRAAGLLLCVPRANVVSYWDLLRVRLSGEAIQYLTFTGPFLAEPTKAWLLKRHGLPVPEGFAANLAEYFTYTFLTAALAIAALIYLLVTVELGEPLHTVAIVVLVVTAAFLLAGIIAILFRLRMISGLVRGVGRLPVVGRKMRPNMEKVTYMEDLLLEMFRDRPGRFASLFAIETVAQALLVLELYWILRGLDLDVSLWLPFLLEAGTKFTNTAFFFIPGRVGAEEGTYAVVFEALGLPAAAGFTMPLIRRLRSMLISGVGLLSLWLASRESVRVSKG